MVLTCTKRDHELPTKMKGSQAVNHNQMTKWSSVTGTEIRPCCLCRNTMLDIGKKFDVPTNFMLMPTLLCWHNKK